MFLDKEIERYSRQLPIDGWGLDGQERLKGSSALVVGAGGSGSVVITELALLGVGKITICDFDTVELSNYNRQFIHSVGGEERIGMNKARSAMLTTQKLNPYVECCVVEEKIDQSNIDQLVQDHDVILDGSDDMVTKFLISKAGFKFQKHHLTWGHMDINAFASVFYPPRTPCFHCFFNADVVRAVEISRRLQKEGKLEIGAYPVMPTPVMVSTAFLLTEAVKILTGIAEPAYNKFFLFLLKGSERIRDSRGYVLWKTWLSSHLVEEARKQGFYFDGEVWRGRFLEELEIRKDPNCVCCGSKNSKA